MMIDPITSWRTSPGAADAARVAVEIRGGDCGSRACEAWVRADRLERYAPVFVHNRLWAAGGSSVRVDAPPAAARRVREAYAPGGAFHHQAALMSRIYGEPFVVEQGAVHAAQRSPRRSGRPGRLEPPRGVRIGVDLGGSDAKVAALEDGALRYTEKRDWSPRSFSLGADAFEAVCRLVEAAAAVVGRMESIGLSTAGVVARGRIMASGIFGGLPSQEFARWIEPMAERLSDRFAASARAFHDGDMTPLWAHLEMGLDNVLGLSLGTGLGGGYVGEGGEASGMLCELGKMILDMSPRAPEHIYNRTRGPALHYCSQNAVFRLAGEAGLDLSAEPSLAAKLRRVQAMAEAGDARARRVFERVGEHLAHAVRETEMDFRMAHVLLVGRVVSGPMGDVVLRAAEAALERKFPETARCLRVHLPSGAEEEGKLREFSQAVAAAHAAGLGWGGAER